MPGVHISVGNYLNLSVDDFTAICEELINQLIEATPVDTGYCADHWRYTVINDDLIEIWNDTEYLSYLEDGHSKQAEAGWIENILSNMSEIIFNYFNG